MNNRFSDLGNTNWADSSGDDLEGANGGGGVEMATKQPEQVREAEDYIIEDAIDSEYQKKIRKNQCCIILIIVIATVILLFAIGVLP